MQLTQQINTMENIPRIIISPFEEYEFKKAKIQADKNEPIDLMVQGLVQKLGEYYHQDIDYQIHDSSQKRHRLISNFFHIEERKKENDQLETIFKVLQLTNANGKMANDNLVLPSFKITHPREEATARARDAISRIPHTAPSIFLVLDGQKHNVFFTVLSAVHGPLQVSCQTENDMDVIVRELTMLNNSLTLSSIIVLGTFAQQINSEKKWKHLVTQSHDKHPTKNKISVFADYQLFSSWQVLPEGEPPTVIIFTSSHYKFIESGPLVFIKKEGQFLNVYAYPKADRHEKKTFSYSAEKNEFWQNVAPYILRSWSNQYTTFLKNEIRP